MSSWAGLVPALVLGISLAMIVVICCPKWGLWRTIALFIALTAAVWATIHILALAIVGHAPPLFR